MFTQNLVAAPYEYASLRPAGPKPQLRKRLTDQTRLAGPRHSRNRCSSPPDSVGVVRLNER